MATKRNSAQQGEIEAMKEELVSLLMACAILPESKVTGKDMFGDQTARGGLKAVYEDKLMEFKWAGATKQDMEDVLTEYHERLQKHLDHEEELDKNEDVDNLSLRFEKQEMEKFDAEYLSDQEDWRKVAAVTEEAQSRHERMVMRLAIVEKLRKAGDQQRLAQVNDDLAQRIIDGEQDFDESLKPFAVDKTAFLLKEKEVLRKNQAAYFKMKLEERANLLRSMVERAERLKGARGRDNQQFVEMVKGLANKTKVFAERRLQMLNNSNLERKGDKRAVASMKNMARGPYSRTALCALYNQAVLSLYILGVFSDIYPKTVNGVALWFFIKPTQQGMVGVKSGSDWAEDIRSLYYESDDGNRRVPVRGSGVDG